MTGYDIAAILPGNIKTVPDSPDILCVCAEEMTAILVPRPYRAMLLPQSRKAVLQAAAARQRVFEAVMPFGTVLPFRPDVVMSPAQVGSFVRVNRPLLDRLADRFADVVQYQITVSWTPQQVLNRFRDSAELEPVFAAGHTSPRILSDAVTVLATRLGDDMRVILGKAVQEIMMLPCAEDMLLNAAVLVKASDVTPLDQAVEALDAIWTEGLQVKQIGPAPGTSFATLDARNVGPAEVKKARQLLGLASDPDDAAIAAARRRALIQRPADAAAIKMAATTVSAVCRSGDSTCLLCFAISDDQAADAQQPNAMAVSA